jgi:hypothetical protein
MRTAWGSFDFAGFFASEETCFAQDDRRREGGRGKPASLRMTEIEIGKVAKRETCFAHGDTTAHAITGASDGCPLTLQKQAVRS